jgi:hypothetical protein
MSATSEKYAAVVFASGNVHCGEPRTIALEPRHWEELAGDLRARGLEPWPVRHRDDPGQSMPGWESLELLCRA